MLIISAILAAATSAISATLLSIYNLFVPIPLFYVHIHRVYIHRVCMHRRLVPQSVVYSTYYTNKGHSNPV